MFQMNCRRRQGIGALLFNSIQNCSLVSLQSHANLIGKLVVKSLNLRSIVTEIPRGPIFCSNHIGSLQRTSSVFHGSLEQFRNFSTEEVLEARSPRRNSFLVRRLAGTRTWSGFEKTLESTRDSIDKRILRIAMMELGDRSSWRRSLWVFRWMQHNKVESLKPDAKDCGIILTILANSKQTTLVRSLYSYMTKAGIETNKYHHTSVIRALCSSNCFEEVEEYINHVKPGERTNLYLWHALLKGYGDDNQEDKMFEVLSRMKEAGLRPDIVTYNTIIGCLGLMGKLTEMEQKFEEMKSEFTPDHVAFVHRLKAYMKGKDLEKFEGVLRELEEAGISWVEHSSYLRVSMYGELGLVEKLDSTVNEILQMSSNLESDLLTTALKQYILLNEFEKASQLIQKFRIRNCLGNRRTVSMLLGLMANLETQTDPEKVSKFLHVLIDIDSTVGDRLSELLNLGDKEVDDICFKNLKAWFPLLRKLSFEYRDPSFAVITVVQFCNVILNLTGNKRVAMSLFDLATKESSLKFSHSLRSKALWTLNLRIYSVSVARMMLTHWLHAVNSEICGEKENNLPNSFVVITGHRSTSLRENTLKDLHDLGLPFQINENNPGVLEASKSEVETGLVNNKEPKQLLFESYGLKQ